MRPSRWLPVLILLLAVPAPAAADTVPIGGLPLPAGAVAGGDAGVVENGQETTVAASDDGRYVAFAATSDGLTADTPPDAVEIYRKDRQTGAIVLVSKGPDGVAAGLPAVAPAISDDGNLVAFRTASPLGEDDGHADVYVRDVSAQTTRLASPNTAQAVDAFDLAAEGDDIAYEQDDAGGQTSQVWRQSLSSPNAPRTIVSARSGTLTPGNGFSGSPSISDDGLAVAFTSTATNLVDNFGGGGIFASNVFVRDGIDSNTRLVSSVSNSSTQAAGGRSERPRISGDSSGMTYSVAFESTATNLDAGDTSSVPSVFRRRSVDGAAVLMSRAIANADGPAIDPDISDDGTLVLFESTATNLGGPGGVNGLYLRQPVAGSTSLVSATGVPVTGGRLFDTGPVWSGRGDTIAGGDAQLSAVFARTGVDGTIEEVSRPGAERVQRAVAGVAETANSSADGRYAVFRAASPLLPSGSATVARTYRRDGRTGEVVLISRADGAAGLPVPSSGAASISADGTRVAFTTGESLDPADGGSSNDVYVRDLAAGTTRLVSRAEGADGVSGTAESTAPAISPDGRAVVFVTLDQAISGASTNQYHLVKRVLATNVNVTVDRASGTDGAIGDRSVSILPAGFSADGRLVAFDSSSTNLDPADTGEADSIFLRDTQTGVTRLVSRRSGADGASADSFSFQPSLSADGRFVAYIANDDAVAPEAGGFGGFRQVVVRDLATHQNVLASRAPGGAPANSSADNPTLSSDGSVVSFSSRGATNLLPAYGATPFVVVRNMATGALDGPPSFGVKAVAGAAGAAFPRISDDGACVTFVAQGHTAAGLGSDLLAPYQYRRSGSCSGPADAPPVVTPPVTPPVPQIIGVPGPKPTLTQVSLSRKTFRVGSKRTATTAAKKKKKKKKQATKAGTAFRFTLDRVATVAIRIDRRTTGRKVGKRCKAPSKKLRKRKACTRDVKAGTITRKGLAAGRRSIAFSGRLGKKALKPGRYRATLVASNLGGKSKAVRLAFEVVKR